MVTEESIHSSRRKLLPLTQARLVSGIRPEKSASHRQSRRLAGLRSGKDAYHSESGLNGGLGFPRKKLERDRPLGPHHQTRDEARRDNPKDVLAVGRIQRQTGIEQVGRIETDDGRGSSDILL